HRPTPCYITGNRRIRRRRCLCYTLASHSGLARCFRRCCGFARRFFTLSWTCSASALFGLRRFRCRWCSGWPASHCGSAAVFLIKTNLLPRINSKGRSNIIGCSKITIIPAITPRNGMQSIAFAHHVCTSTPTRLASLPYPPPRGFTFGLVIVHGNIGCAAACAGHRQNGNKEDINWLHGMHLLFRFTTVAFAEEKHCHQPHCKS